MIKSRHHLAAVIAKRTLHINGTDRLAQEIAAYLLSEQQTAELESLVRDIMQYRSDHGIVEAVVVSAHELTNDILADIRKVLKDNYPAADTILLDQQLDVSVVGGVRIDLANEQLDASTRGKLNTFKRLTGAGKD